jgi:hypothetical protein
VRRRYLPHRVLLGNTRTEDILLDVPGLLAFVVALLPTTTPMLCGAGLSTRPTL